MRNILLIIVVLLTFVNGQNEERAWNRDDTFCGNRNCYEIIGIPENAEYAEIKALKNELSKKYHPDKNPDDPESAQVIMAEINIAWEVLKNPERRKQYDAMLRTKRALDSPQENIIIVGALIFGLLTFVVAQYKKENYRQVKRSIIATPQVKRVFDFNKSNESASDSDKSPSVKKKSKKSKRKKKEKIEDINLEDYDDDQLNSIIKEINLKVLGWPGRAPTYTDAAVIVLQSPVTVTLKVCQSVWWLIRFNLLGQEMSDDDIKAQILSRFSLTEDFWNKLTPEQQAGYRKDYLDAEKKSK